MNLMFDNLENACVWLYTQGYRQNEAGEWLRENRKATIHHSPANDGVVSVSTEKVS